VTISRFQAEFIVNFRVLPNSRNGVYAHTNRLKSRNESVNFASHKHINSFRDLSAYSEAQTDGHIYMASSIWQAILINMCCL